MLDNFFRCYIDEFFLSFCNFFDYLFTCFQQWSIPWIFFFHFDSNLYLQTHESEHMTFMQGFVDVLARNFSVHNNCGLLWRHHPTVLPEMNLMRDAIDDSWIKDDVSHYCIGLKNISSVMTLWTRLSVNLSCDLVPFNSPSCTWWLAASGNNFQLVLILPDLSV